MTGKQSGLRYRGRRGGGERGEPIAQLLAGSVTVGGQFLYGEMEGSVSSESPPLLIGQDPSPYEMPSSHSSTKVSKNTAGVSRTDTEVLRPPYSIVTNKMQRSKDEGK